jgi:8-oxo-dGTP pyrophosphatase MutT (NUDIX family)
VIEKWTTISSAPAGDFKVFKVRSVAKRSPRTGQTHQFSVIDSVDWVNVVALTPDRCMVLVEQYRHGSDTIELEIPGGMMDPGDKQPEAAGVRELREETGYEGRNARMIGQIFPNPAIMSNTCYTVLVEDCQVAGATQFDQTEDLVTRLVPIDEVSGLVASGKIKHCIVVAALFHFELWRKQNPV